MTGRPDPETPPEPDPREEVLDVVDAEDGVVGQARRADVYARRLLHRTVMVVVRNPAGHVLVHRRTPTKLVMPGRYDMMVGGVVDAGEAYDAAARRELAEEVGVDATPRPVFAFRYEPAAGVEAWPQWIHVYEVDWAGPVTPQASEVAWWTWLPAPELAARLEAGDWEFCPDSLAVWARYLAQGRPT